MEKQHKGSGQGYSIPARPFLFSIMAKPEPQTVKLAIALILYFILAMIATFALDGILRTVMWIFFAGLAIKTVIAANNDRTMD